MRVKHQGYSSHEYGDGNVKKEPGHELFRAKDLFTLVIFGASGDLSRRKLIPALYHLNETDSLPDRYAVVGFSRTEMTDDAYRSKMLEALQEQVGQVGNIESGARTVQADNTLIQALYYHTRQ